MANKSSICVSVFGLIFSVISLALHVAAFKLDWYAEGFLGSLMLVMEDDVWGIGYELLPAVGVGIGSVAVILSLLDVFFADKKPLKLFLSFTFLVAMSVMIAAVAYFAYNMVMSYVKTSIDFTSLTVQQQEDLVTSLNTTVELLEQDFEQFLEDAVSSIFNWSTLGAWGLITATICAVWELLVFIYFSVIGCCVKT